MASTDDRYLPDLLKVLTGDATAFSWQQTYRSLKESKTGADIQDFEVLTTSPKIKTILQQHVPILPPPSSQSKSTFESKTSAIHATPSADTSSNISRIKEDATWLSKKYKVSEDEALRVTVLEWEHQPGSRLRSGFTDAEQASLHAIFGKDNNIESNAVDQLLPLRSDEAFDGEIGRRSRLVQIFFREQAGLIATWKELHSLASLPRSRLSKEKDLLQFAKQITQQFTAYASIKDILNNIEHRIQTITDEHLQDEDGLQLHDLMIAAECQNIRLLLDIVLLRIRESDQLTMPKELVLQWFHIAKESDFFSKIASPSQDLLRQLQATTAIISIAFLDAASAIATISGSATDLDTTGFYLDPESATEVTQTLLTAVEMSLFQAGPAALVWSLILDGLRSAAMSARESRESQHVQKAIDQGQNSSPPTTRRTSYGSLQQSAFEDVMDHLLSRSPVTDPVGYLLRCSTEISHAFDAISELAISSDSENGLVADVKMQVLQEAVTVTVSGLGYTPDVLRMQFAVLAGHDTADSVTTQLDIRESFIEDDFLMSNLFAVAAGRFPYESLPFLRLCRLLMPAKIFDKHGVHYIAYRLRNLESFTQAAVGAFASYDTVREDENLNLVTLENDANMVGAVERKLLTYGTDLSFTSVVPADTLGEVISEAIPPVIRWQHSFSGLLLLGTWLELHYLGQLQVVIGTRESAADIVTEVVLILSSLLSTTLNNTGDTSATTDRQSVVDELLNEASGGMQNDYDVVTCIFEIIEQELQHFRRRPSNTFNTSLLVACIKFITSLVQARPEQFWALIGNSSLLQSYGSSDFLHSIVVSVEVPNHSYPFLNVCALLYKEMITAALLASRTLSQSSRATAYHNIAPQTQKLHASIILSLTRSLYVVFGSLTEWTFQSTPQMLFIIKSISLSFSTIAFYAYGIGEGSSKQNSIFRPACDFTSSQIRSSIRDESGATAILKVLIRTALSSIDPESLDIDAPALFATSILSLAHIFVRLGSVLNDPPSLLETQLLDAMPVLVRILSMSGSASLQAAKLILDLLPAVESTRTVSLLGHLGSISSMCLIQLLKSKQQFADNVETAATIWKLFAALVGQKQQWLALVILTGSPPDKKSIESESPSKGPGQGRGSTIMDVALTRLTKINGMTPQLAIAILEFVIQAQQNWSWTAIALKREKDFLPALMTYIRDTFVDTSSPLKLSYRNKIVALVADLSTTHLHYARVTQEKDIIKTLMSMIFVFAENKSITAIANFNTSLHTNLKRNFAAKFPGLDISDFKRSQLVEGQYGEDYYYDISCAEKILQHNHHWSVANLKQDQSFAAEFRRANLNLSVTESEIVLFHSAKHFLLEHCDYFIQDEYRTGTTKPQNFYSTKAIYDAMASIVRSCLKANTDVYPVQKLFEDLLQSRADLAIGLLQKLVDVKAKGFEIKGLLGQAWLCACSRNSSYEQALANNDLIYWRSSLKIVLLALQFHCGGVWSPPAFNHEAADMLRQEMTNITPVILEITTIVIGEGFQTVVTAIQDQRQTAQQASGNSTVVLGDLSLILSLLNSTLRITRAPEFITEGSGRLISSGIIPACCLLYSWSHTLTDPQHDSNPTYADLALQYLSGLSTLAPVAEEMGIEGVLSRLLSGRTTQKLQSVPEGASHLDQRPHCQYLYGLWASGMLPICLNMLHSMGAPIAAEVAVFLNQFPKQLARASSAFVPAAQFKAGKSNSITYEVAREAATLSLISFILDSYRQAGASAAVDPAMIMPLKGYDEHKKALSDDISDIINTGLSGRIVGHSEDDAEMMRRKDGPMTVLEKKISQELKDALVCLRGVEVDDEDDK